MTRREKIDNPNIRIGEHQSIEDLTGGRIRKWHGGHPGHAGYDEDPSGDSGNPDGPSAVGESGLSRSDAIDRAVDTSDVGYTKGERDLHSS